MIWCCKECVAPKRHPGCHDRCPEYIKEKAVHEAEREERLKVKIRNWNLSQHSIRSSAIRRTTEIRNRYKD